MDTENKKFYDRIKTLLTEQHKSLYDLCKEIDTPYQNFANKKTRQTYPNVLDCLKIAAFLNTTVEYLVTGEEISEYKIKFDCLSEDIQNIIDKYKKNERLTRIQ